MSFDFPSSPTEGQTYTPAGGPSFIYYAPAWRQVTIVQAMQLATAESRNRIVNGAFQISQENGDTAGGNGWYPADQWIAAGAGITAGRSFAPAEGYRIYHDVPAKASLAASDLVWMAQSIEGNRVSDLFYGQSSAKASVLRFDAFCTKAGTYSFSIRNAAVNRAFIAPFTLAASVWATITIVIPGDATGTWPTGTAKNMDINFSIAAGSTYVGVNGWQAGNKLGSPDATNGIATGASFYLRNVGLYADPNNTGIAPPWQTPDEVEELRACQRYYERIGMTLWNGANPYYNTSWYMAQKRIAPAITLGSSTANGGTIGGMGYSADMGMRQITASTTPVDAWYHVSARM